jgi:hypothetical protein
MIQILPFKQIHKEQWDTCVRESYAANIYGLYESICIACENWVGIVYGKYEAVLALPVKKKIGLTYSWHPQFMGPLGVFTRLFDAAIEAEILDEAAKLSWWIKMFYWQNQAGSNFKITPWAYQELDLSDSVIKKIRSGYNDNTKRNLKKASKHNLSIQRMQDVGLVVQQFMQHKGQQINNIKPDSYQLLSQLMNHWLSKKLGHITGVYQNEELVAIGYFLTWNSTVIYYKGAVTNLGKQVGAMHFLIDHEIENSLGKYSCFDFGGSNAASVSRFYRGFGGVDKHYYLYEYKRFKI